MLGDEAKNLPNASAISWGLWWIGVAECMECLTLNIIICARAACWLGWLRTRSSWLLPWKSYIAHNRRATGLQRKETSLILEMILKFGDFAPQSAMAAPFVWHRVFESLPT